jgi:hypothetical protein
MFGACVSHGKGGFHHKGGFYPNNMSISTIISSITSTIISTIIINDNWGERIGKAAHSATNNTNTSKDDTE